MDQYLYKMYKICCNTIPTFARYTDILLIAIFIIPKNCRDVLWMHSKRKSPWGFSSTMGTKGLLRYTACSKVRKAIDNCGIFLYLTLSPTQRMPKHLHGISIEIYKIISLFHIQNYSFMRRTLTIHELYQI